MWSLKVGAGLAGGGGAAAARAWSRVRSRQSRGRGGLGGQTPPVEAAPPLMPSNLQKKGGTSEYCDPACRGLGLHISQKNSLLSPYQPPQKSPGTVKYNFTEMEYSQLNWFLQIIDFTFHIS